MKTHPVVTPPAARHAARSHAFLAALGSLVLALPSVGLASDAPAASGQWMLEWRQNKERVQMTFTWKRPDGRGHCGDEIPLARLEGLTAEQIDGRSSAVRFELRRDAGTFVCEGRAGDGAGAGLYELRLDPSFAEGLRRRGIGAPSESQQIRLAFADAGYALLDELKARKYPTPSLALLVQMAEHGVDQDYVAGMGRLGYRPQGIPELITLRDHGVDPRYIENLRDAGFTGLTIDELLHARDHGVDGRFLADMREYGHGGLSLAEYVRLRDHGVDGTYLRGMAEAGHGELPLSELTRSRDHGVDPRYIRAMAEAGYKDLPLGELVRSRDHGVDARYIRGLAEAGYKDLPLDDLIRARDHGVDARFARRVNDRLGKKVSLDRLIAIRDRGEMD